MSLIESYFAELSDCTRLAEVTDRDGNPLSISLAVLNVLGWLEGMEERSNKLMFVGNGGSSGICGHMAIDYMKNGGICAMAFNDPAALTCLSNDYSYSDVFAKQVEWHGAHNDTLVAISSSGKSPNILNAVEAMRKRPGTVITFSGFSPDNPLRTLGDLNFYVPSDNYGFVETAHQAILHAILDIRMGWKPKETT